MWTRALTILVLFLLVICCDHTLVAGQNTTTGFAFPSFPVDDDRILRSGDVYFNSFQSSYDLNSNRNGYCGRILYKDKVRLKDKATGTVASFSTSFTFSFISNASSPDHCGDGMVFTLVANPSISLEEGSRSICSFDYYPGEARDQRVFAVKFDSYRNSNLRGSGYVDPSDGSIGVMVNMIDGTLLPIPQYNLCADSSYNTTECEYFCGNKGDFSAWIDYNSPTQTLEVRFRSGPLTSGVKPAIATLTVPNLSLGDVLDEEMYVAFTAETYWLSFNPETHRVSSWYFNSTDPVQSSPAPSPSASPSDTLTPKYKVGLIAGICAAIVGAVVCMGLCLFFVIRKFVRNKQTVEKLDTASFNVTDQSSRPFTFKELSSITNNFADSELLSSGAFGDVFKGTPPVGTLVAVKRIKKHNGKGEESFQAEATSLRQIRHRNLLHLRGWCQAKDGLQFLVYDYMSNSSLDKWLYRDPTVTVFDSGLSWNVRCHILAGVAAGLTYLHEECVQCVLHRDIKSSNVLLDANFNACLGDFGLARLVDHEKLQKTTMLAGTLGYMAPELLFTGRATKETDVYAFGILVLEVVCGRRPLDKQLGVDPGDYMLLDRVWRAHETGNMETVVDPKLNIQLSDVYQWVAMLASVLQVGLLCCLPNPSERPSMRVLNQWFQSIEAGTIMELPPLPATKPVPAAQYSMPPSPQDGTSSSQSSNVTKGSSNFQTWASIDKARA